MKDWERIRAERENLTDYVIHFTRLRLADSYPFNVTSAHDVLIEILNYGYIRPSFAMKANRNCSTPRATVKGPDPAVCLTEQPLSAIVKTRCVTPRYSGYGIAYHKVALHNHGGRPVLYSTERELGEKIKEREAGWQEGKDIWKSGLPEHLQYLWVRYQPEMPGYPEFPVDFTWERERRIKPRGNGLPILLDSITPQQGTIIVEKDEDIAFVRGHVNRIASCGAEWAKHLQYIVSLETAKLKLTEKDNRYARLDTWPHEV